MLIELILFLIMGTITGTITGLIPGIHINLVGATILGLSATLFGFVNPIFLVVFISAMAITHTFVDFIPSIFLGCPDTDTELSVLPGHELLKKGEGYEAIMLTAYGGIAAVFILVIIAFPSILIISKTYDSFRNFIPYILVLVSIILVSLEKKKFSALLVFLLTGILGFCVLNLQTLKEPLLPLLTGLFGASTLILSIKTKTKIENQIISIPKIEKDFFKPILGAAIASPITSFLPGLGSGQAAIIGNTIVRSDKRGFLILLGATNTLVMGFSFISLYIISRTRTGAAVAIQGIIGNLSWKILLVILLVVLFSGIISFFLVLFLGKFFSKKIGKISYTKLSIMTLLILGIIVLLISGFPGLIILIISTFTGIYSISKGVRRTQMMGCLLLPTIIFYLL